MAKYARVIRAKAPALDPLLLPFYQRVPRMESRRSLHQFLAILPFLAGFVLIALAAKGFPELGHGWRAAPLVVGAIGAGIWATVKVTRGTERQYRARLKERDEKSFRPRPDELYVGIAYADGLWTLGEDDSWDRGYLHLTEDWIAFRGCAGRFRFPVGSVYAVRLAAPDEPFRINLPRVYVEWQDAELGWNVFSLEIPRTLPPSEVRLRTEALAERLEALRLRSHPTNEVEADWPFVSARLSFSCDPDRQAVTGPDRAVALLAAIATGASIMAAIAAITSVLHWPFPDWIGGLVTPFCLVAFNAAVVYRVRRRARP